jgi:hypothetical protein
LTSQAPGSGAGERRPRGNQHRGEHDDGERHGAGAGQQAARHAGDPTLTLLAGALGVMMVETPASPAASSFDLPGIATLSGALFLLIWGLIKGSSYGWGSGRTLMFLGAAVLLGLLFVVRESRAAQPLLPLRLFRSASPSAGVALVILLMFALGQLGSEGAQARTPEWINGNAVRADAIDSQTEAPDRRWSSHAPLGGIRSITLNHLPYLG